MSKTKTTELTPLKKVALGGGVEGAERTTREMARWTPPIISPDQQFAITRDLAVARSQNMVQNDGYAMGALQIHRDSIVGAQYRLNSKPNWRVLGVTEEWAEEFQQHVEAHFNLVADSPENWFDASRTNTLTSLVRLAVTGFMMTGEVLSTVEWIRETGRPFSTAIQMISPVRLSNPEGMMDSVNLKSGIKQNTYGKPLGYYIQKSFPGDFTGANDWGWAYVPAAKPWGRRQVIHIIEQLLPGQSRGVSEMVSVLKQMRMTRNFQEITLQNAVVNASYAAAIESELPSDVVFGQIGVGSTPFGEILGSYMTSLLEYTSGAKNIAIDGVKIPHLFPGTKLKMQPMGTPGGIGGEFEESLLRNTAAALGLSYEQFSRDYTKTNYSSARASMGETWKFMLSRKKMVADRFASAIYMLWMEEQINAGTLPLPPGKDASWFYEPLVKDALCAAEWIGASRGQIDEKKETEAAILRIKNGLSTYEKEIARLGDDWRDVFEQRAREEKIIEEKELNFTGQPVQEETPTDQTDQTDSNAADAKPGDNSGEDQ